MRDVALELFREGNPVQYGPFMIEHRQRLLEPIDVFGPDDVQEVDRREGAAFVQELFSIASHAQNITQYVFLLDWILNKGRHVEYASPNVCITHTLSRNAPLSFFKQLLEFPIIRVTQWLKCAVIFRTIYPHNSDQLAMLFDFIEQYPEQFNGKYYKPVESSVPSVDLIHASYELDEIFNILKKCNWDQNPDNLIERMKTTRLFFARFHIMYGARQPLSSPLNLYSLVYIPNTADPALLMTRNEVRINQWMMYIINNSLSEAERYFIKFNINITDEPFPVEPFPVDDMVRLNAIKQFMRYYINTGDTTTLTRSMDAKCALVLQQPVNTRGSLLPLYIENGHIKNVINAMDIINQMLTLDIPREIVIYELIPLQFGPINERVQSLFPYCVQKYLDNHNPLYQSKRQKTEMGFVLLN